MINHWSIGLWFIDVHRSSIFINHYYQRQSAKVETLPIWTWSCCLTPWPMLKMCLSRTVGMLPPISFAGSPVNLCKPDFGRHTSNGKRRSTEIATQHREVGCLDIIQINQLVLRAGITPAALSQGEPHVPQLSLWQLKYQSQLMLTTDNRCWLILLEVAPCWFVLINVGECWLLVRFFGFDQFSRKTPNVLQKTPLQSVENLSSLSFRIVLY